MNLVCELDVWYMFDSLCHIDWVNNLILDYHSHGLWLMSYPINQVSIVTHVFGI